MGRSIDKQLHYGEKNISRELSKTNCATIKIVKIGPNELVNEEHLVMIGPESKTRETVITL